MRVPLLVTTFATCASTASVLSSNIHAAHAQSYTVADLGTLGGTQARTAGVDGPAVVGSASTPAGPSFHATIWRDGTATDLGTLGFPVSIGVDVTRAGNVAVGWVQNVPNTVFRPFIWRFGTMEDLGTLGGANGRANRINHRLQAVGFSHTAAGEYHATLWQPDGSTVDLGTLGGHFSGAAGINDRGQISGFSVDAAGIEHPVLWDQRHRPTLLGSFPGRPHGRAVRVNDVGQAIGWMSTQAGVVDAITGLTHAFFWDAGVANDLGTLGGAQSRAYGLNNRGDVVGEAQAANGVFHGFIWTNGQMLDLNNLIPADPGLLITSARGIDEDGNIVAWGMRNGLVKAIVLSPAE